MYKMDYMSFDKLKMLTDTIKVDGHENMPWQQLQNILTNPSPPTPKPAPKLKKHMSMPAPRPKKCIPKPAPVPKKIN